MHRTQNRRQSTAPEQRYGPEAIEAYRTDWRLAKLRLVTARAEFVRHRRGCPACAQWQPDQSDLPSCHQGRILTSRRRQIIRDIALAEERGKAAANPPGTLF